MRRQTSECPAEVTLAVIGGRWKVPILFHLFQGGMRFSELFRALDGITQKMLTQQLRELEKDGVVRRTVHAQVPPRVDYALTPLGQSLKSVVESMCAWGRKQRARAADKAAVVTHLSHARHRALDRRGETVGLRETAKIGSPGRL